MTQSDPNLVASACVFFMFTGVVFAGLLGGVLVPQIERAAYIPTQCFIQSTNIDYRYSCGATCSACTESFGLPTCSGAVAANQALNPKLCLSGTTSQCARQGQQCSDGYRCCNTVCQTCQKCSTSCSGNPQKCTCTNYPCQCVCISSVQNDLCSISCSTIYTAYLYVKYTIHGNSTTVQSTLSSYFGTDLAGAQAYVRYYESFSTHGFACFYDPANPQTIVLNNSYDAWAIAVFTALGAFPFLCALMFGSAVFFFDGALGPTIALWLGLIVPIVVFIPIAVAGALTQQQREILMVSAFVMIGVFTAFAFPSKHWAVHGIFFTIPISVLTPIALYVSYTVGVALIAITYIVAACIMCFACCLGAEGRARWAAAPVPTRPPPPPPVMAQVVEPPTMAQYVREGGDELQGDEGQDPKTSVVLA